MTTVLQALYKQVFPCTAIVVLPCMLYVWNIFLNRRTLAQPPCHILCALEVTHHADVVVDAHLSSRICRLDTPVHYIHHQLASSENKIIAHCKGAKSKISTIALGASCSCSTASLYRPWAYSAEEQKNLSGPFGAIPGNFSTDRKHQRNVLKKS